ncbi:MAG: single-stranded DNA-binding protein [Actinobacteria bacterium]|nr:single-stranded DNA-binding protein [Actinomycetota bacterium]
MYFNSIALVGNLTSDPKAGSDGLNVTNFRVAVNRMRRPDEDKEATPQSRTEFLDVECWGVQAANILDSLKKGDRVVVVGELKHDQWVDDNGNPKSKTKIKAGVVGSSLEFQALPA